MKQATMKPAAAVAMHYFISAALFRQFTGNNYHQT